MHCSGVTQSEHLFSTLGNGETLTTDKRQETRDNRQQTTDRQTTANAILEATWLSTIGLIKNFTNICLLQLCLVHLSVHKKLSIEPDPLAKSRLLSGAQYNCDFYTLVGVHGFCTKAEFWRENNIIFPIDCHHI